MHPKKEEVRFTKPGIVEASLQISVRMSLEQTLSQKLQTTQQVTQDTSQILLDTDFRDRNTSHSPGVFDSWTKINSQEDFEETIPANPIHNEIFNRSPDFNRFASNLSDGLKYSVPSVVPSAGARTEEAVGRLEVQERAQDLRLARGNQHTIFNPDTKKQAFGNANIIGQVFNTYLILESISETGSELILIDQHAAHERVLYEEFLKNFEKKDGIALMFPDLVTLTSHQIDAIMREKDFFFDQGISFDLMGNNTIAIKSAPPKIHQQSLKELLLEAVCFIQEHEALERELFRKKLNEHVHSHMACKAAVKAGDVLTMQQMQQLVIDLEKTEKRFICVHGRPTTWSISKDLIEKNFRRK